MDHASKTLALLGYLTQDGTQNFGAQNRILFLKTTNVAKLGSEILIFPNPMPMLQLYRHHSL